MYQYNNMLYILYIFNDINIMIYILYIFNDAFCGCSYFSLRTSSLVLFNIVFGFRLIASYIAQLSHWLLFWFV